MSFRHFIYVIAGLFAILLLGSCENTKQLPNDGSVPDDTTGTGDIETTDEGEFITAGNASNSNNYGEDATAGGTDDEGAPSNEDDKGDDAAREIVEADIYKVEGNILWVLNQYRGLVAIDVTEPTALKILGRSSFKGFPFEMYVQEGRAYVMVTGLRYNPSEKSEDGGYYDASRTFSELIVVDIADPTKQKILGRYMMEGTIIDSRQVGDVLYVAASETRYYWYYCDNAEERGKDQITLLSLNIADPKNIKKADEEHLDGTGYALYVTDHSIYVAETNLYYWQDGYYTDGVPVHYFDISDPAGAIEKKGVIKTRGYIGDRWKMHEKDGAFFAVTSTSQWWNGENAVESFDVTDPSNPKKISEFTFMTNQELHGARFDGNRLYAVTYFQQDPLHVIDITDPAKMKELGQLAVPGWSTHIEIRGTKLLTVGIDDQDGWNAKVSMYDVADPTNPTEMTTVELGGAENGYSWSEATNDWKAFKIYDAIGLILVPTSEWNYNTYREVNRLHLIDFDLESGLTKRGSVESPGYVRRGVVVGDHIASVGDTTVMMIDYSDRDNPEILSSLPVAYAVENLFSCAGKLCGTKGTSWYDSDIRLVTYDASKDYPVNWSSDRVRGQYVYAMQNDAKAVHMFSYDSSYTYDEEKGGEYYEENVYATRFDLAEGKDPKPAGSLKLELPPQDQEGEYWYWYGRAFAVAESKAAGMMSTRYDYYCLADDAMVDCAMEGVNYENYYYFNKSKLAVYDLRDLSKESAAPVLFDKEFRGVTYNNTVIARGDKLWATDCKLHAWDDEGRELLICYAQAVDVADPAKPALAEKYNIPGELVGMSDDGTIFYTLMRTWIKTDEDGKRGDYYYSSNYLYHLNILKKSADGKKLTLVKVIPYHEEYTYTENTSEYLWSSYLIQDKKVFLNTIQQTYHWEEQQCSYYSTTVERTSTVAAYDGATGAKIMEDVVPDGIGMSGVDGGGVLIQRQTDAFYYYYYGSEGREYTYIAPDGTMTELALPEVSYYADYYYYYNGNKAVRQGDNLVIARGWEGLTTVSLKP